MLEGKQLILATKPFTKEDRFKSWLYTLSTLLFLVGSIVGTFVMPTLLLRIVCSLFNALLIIRYFVIYHDFLHHAILNKSKIANFIMTIFGIYVLAPTSIWKRSHDYHHQNNSKLYTSSIGSFPIVTKENFFSMSKKERNLYLFIRHPLTILFGYLTMFLLGMCLRSFICNPKKHPDSFIALLAHLIFSVVVFYYFGWMGYLLSVFFPFFISLAIGSYYFYAQHNFPTSTFSCKNGWTYESAALDSSSFMKMNRIMQWFSANIGFHHIHHLNARIPFYRLPEAMNALPELQNPKTTSLKLSEMIACLKLKVWDEELGKMVGIK